MVYHDEINNKPYFGLGQAGVLVKVGVSINNVEHISYLPCMDFRNNAIPESEITAMDVNKAIQRATVKAIGLHGLGLYIYAGEDLPEEESSKKEAKAPTRTPAKKEKNVEALQDKKEDEAPKETKGRRGFRRREK